jgi:hypothetical protein
MIMTLKTESMAIPFLGQLIFGRLGDPKKQEKDPS